MERLSAPERTREELRALMNGELGTAAGRSDLVRLALRLIVEEALEGEVADALGRERYARGDRGKTGYRNGYRMGKVKTAEGAVDYSAPQVRETPEPFVSGVRAALSGRTQALEDLAVELYARGLSTRDIEDAFTDESGRRLLSRAAVSEITERLWAEYEGFSKRDLSEHAIAYLYVDGIAERLRPGQRREAVLAAWGIGADGRKVLLALMAGSKEDVETVRAFFQDLRARGLGDPLLVVSDGAPGVIRAIEECFPRSARQRCLAHRMRNLAVKVPTDLWPEFKTRVTACYQAPSRAIARDLASGIRADHATTLPSAIACFDDDFEACVAHLRLPVTHRRLTRTTNLLERLFVEERRRLKIIPNGFGEKPVLKLMFGALIRAAERWRGLRFTEFELRQLAALRKELDEEYEASITPPARSSQPRFSSKSMP
ncbi:MAG TPA: IS256 family transposase [Roseiarcus sp.]|jgi:transposase-like protein